MNETGKIYRKAQKELTGLQYVVPQVAEVVDRGAVGKVAEEPIE
jgi:hypothetical protein